VNEVVARGIYDATTLSAIDTDLATVNIKNGITIFGFVGSANVHDISDATAVAAEVIDGETFYAVSGGIRTGTMPTVALDPAANDYPTGYHAGAASLTAIDAHLAAGNIKDGVEIFGVTGTLVEGVDVSDANALVEEVKTGRTFYSVAAPRKTGTMPIVALDPAANDYPAGYHAGAASLTAIDAQLVTGSIKFGVTIFGVAGHTNVRDSSDANATATRVRSGYTFYAGGGARKTGTLATRTLSPANDTVAAGYYA
ncbi:unnamed protein product, partial [marine sediment metagenome]